MGHAENKLKWCLNKAKKEIERGKTHRGLLKKEPDMNEARGHIAKAEHDLAAISYMEKGGFSDWSMGAAFYSMYHCFLAITEKFGYKENRKLQSQKSLIFDDCQKLKISEVFRL